MAKRTKDGMNIRKIIRCLKRYVGRENYRAMKTARHAPLVDLLRPLFLALGLAHVAVAINFGFLAGHALTDRTWQIQGR